MSTRFVGGLQLWVVRGVLLTVGMSALGCAPNPPDESPGAASSNNPICPQCEVTGGETSDFGLIAPPTPCEASRTASSIDETEARALGFGATLDLVTGTFQAPFEWTPEDTYATAVEGYEPLTGVTGTTTVASIKHLVPTLADCSDGLLLELSLSFRTLDGALSIEGPMSVVVESDEQAPSGYARLNLTDAQGSLRLFPPPSSRPLVGRVGVALRFFPDGVRGLVMPSVTDAATEGRDYTEYSYKPLTGRWPVDDCDYMAWPLGASDSGATPSGASALDLRDELQSVLDARTQTATWHDGAKTTVAVQLGSPSAICLDDGGLSYALQVAVQSADGRLRLEHLARAHTSFDATGAAESTWFEVYETEPMSVERFGQMTGVADVDFGQAGTTTWYTLIEFSPSLKGTLVAVPVDVDGSIGGIENAFLDPIVVLRWSE